MRESQGSYTNKKKILCTYRLSLTSNQFEIEVWMTHDKGLTWTKTPVTTHSTQVSKSKPDYINTLGKPILSK